MEPACECRIILVRHGETEANRRRCFGDSDEIRLTDTGRLQATQLALRLANEFRPTILISSHYARARETSEIIGEALGLNAEVVPGLHERDFGCLRGRPYEHLGELMTAEIFNDPIRTRAWKPEGGESLEDVRARVIPIIENLRACYPGQQVLVVCHGAVIRAICAHITGEWDETWVIGNCGITVIDYSRGNWQRPIALGDREPITTRQPLRAG